MAAGPDPIFRRDIIIPGESPASRGNTRYYVLLSDPTIDRHGGDVSIATRHTGMGKINGGGSCDARSPRQTLLRRPPNGFEKPNDFYSRLRCIFPLWNQFLLISFEFHRSDAKRSEIIERSEVKLQGRDSRETRKRKAAVDENEKIINFWPNAEEGDRQRGKKSKGQGRGRKKREKRWEEEAEPVDRATMGRIPKNQRVRRGRAKYGRGEGSS